jgi:hypothetical protein
VKRVRNIIRRIELLKAIRLPSGDYRAPRREQDR